MQRSIYAIIIVVCGLFSYCAHAQAVNNDEDNEIAVTAYLQGLQLGAAIQRKKDEAEIAALKAKLEASKPAPKE